MYDKLKIAIEQILTHKQIIILSVLLVFIISAMVSYFGTQNMYHDIIQQKIMRDKANKL